VPRARAKPTHPNSTGVAPARLARCGQAKFPQSAGAHRASYRDASTQSGETNVRGSGMVRDRPRPPALRRARLCCRDRCVATASCPSRYVPTLYRLPRRAAGDNGTTASRLEARARCCLGNERGARGDTNHTLPCACCGPARLQCGSISSFLGRSILSPSRPPQAALQPRDSRAAALSPGGLGQGALGLGKRSLDVVCGALRVQGQMRGDSISSSSGRSPVSVLQPPHSSASAASSNASTARQPRRVTLPGRLGKRSAGSWGSAR
jgi:hypothetical protein